MRVITKTGKYVGTCGENYPRVWVWLCGDWSLASLNSVLMWWTGQCWRALFVIYGNVWSLNVLFVMILTVTAWWWSWMSCFLICGLAGAGDVGRRGVLQVGCEHVYGGIFLCTNF